MNWVYLRILPKTMHQSIIFFKVSSWCRCCMCINVIDIFLRYTRLNQCLLYALNNSGPCCRYKTKNVMWSKGTQCKATQDKPSVMELSNLVNYQKSNKQRYYNQYCLSNVSKHFPKETELGRSSRKKMWKLQTMNLVYQQERLKTSCCLRARSLRERFIVNERILPSGRGSVMW